MSGDIVDVVVLTKNSERVLNECLRSIYWNLPVNRLIIVDGYSTDSTLQIVQKFQEENGNVVLLMDNGTRGSARMRGIKEVETEWFVFVDSDVILCDKWYEKARKLVGDDVGAVWGIEIWDGLQSSAMLGLYLRVTRKIFDLRGGTHDLLVRYEAVKDIKIPGNLHVFEDTLIKEWIERRGYRLIAAYSPYCIHRRPPEAWTIKGSLKILAENIQFSSIWKLPKLSVAYGFYTAYIIYKSLQMQMLMRRMKNDRGNMGNLRCNPNER